MTDLNIAVIGCGDISTRYLQNAPLFRGLRIVARANRTPGPAERQAARFGLEALTIEAALARPDIGAIVNLTAAGAHAAVTEAALAAGKHVYSEKPLATSSGEARRLAEMAHARGLVLAVAPDTFLGPGARISRALVDGGKVGRIVAGTAMLMSHGMEHWHRDPTAFYARGGGPVLDFGPYYITALVNLLGPVRRVMAMTGSATPDRLVTAEGSMNGRRIPVETPTTALALLQFESGALVTLVQSWDVWRHGHRPLELYGTEGSLLVPDPNYFGGVVEFTEGRGDWQRIETAGETCGLPNFTAAGLVQANYRMLGVADFAAAIREGRAPRASTALGLHVLEVLEAVLAAGESGAAEVISGGERPQPISAAEVDALLVDPSVTVSAS